jgi:hypothetical protein
VKSGLEHHNRDEVVVLYKSKTRGKEVVVYYESMKRKLI